MCLATMAYVCAACTVCATIFSTGGEILTSFKFYGVTRSYSLPSHPVLVQFEVIL